MPVDKTLSGINNLVKLLPTTTLFDFQTLNPSFTNKGECFTANRYLTAALIVVFSVSCAFTSITDSVLYNGKVYFGIATFTDFYVINASDGEELSVDERRSRKIRLSDGVHVFFSLLLFLALSFSDSYVNSCYFHKAGNNENQLLSNLPLGLGFVASFVFLLFPNTRKGIGYSDWRQSSDGGGSGGSSSKLELKRPV